MYVYVCRRMLWCPIEANYRRQLGMGMVARHRRPRVSIRVLIAGPRPIVIFVVSHNNCITIDDFFGFAMD